MPSSPDALDPSRGVPLPDSGEVRVGPLMPVADLLREHGADPSAVLMACGLPADALTDADRRMSVRLPTGQSWQPRNSGDDYAGDVSLLRGLAESRNSATVALGLQVGVPSVLKTLRALGVTRGLPEVPAVMPMAAV